MCIGCAVGGDRAPPFASHSRQGRTSITLGHVGRRFQYFFLCASIGRTEDVGGFPAASSAAHRLGLSRTSRQSIRRETGWRHSLTDNSGHLYPEYVTMRPISVSLTTLRVLVVGWALPLIAQEAPCAQITAACKSAGLTLGGLGTGTGLQVDCIVPIMHGVAQPAGATLPLPQVAPQLVAACKARNPAFGQKKAPAPTADVARASANASVPLPAPTLPRDV
jgi:hypothetical protein